MPDEHWRIWLLFVFLSRLLISHLSLAILFMAPRPLCLGSSLFVVAFSSCSSSMVVSFAFSLPGHQVFIPFILLSFGVCARIWCLTLSYYLLALPRPLRWFSLSVAYQYAVLDPLAGGHAFLFYWLLAHSGELGQSSVCISNFSIVSSSLSDLLLLCRISLVSLPGSLGPSVVRILGFPPSSPSSFHPSRCRLVFSRGSSPSGVTFIHRFRLSSPAPALSLSLPLFLGCSSFSVLSTPYVFGVVSPSLHGFLLFISLG